MPKMIELRGKTVLVSGASSGIGRAVSRAFARAGFRVALAARRVELLEELAGSLRAEGAEILVLPCDVRNRRQTLEAVESVVSKWGRLDVLVNNAGVSKLDFFERQDLDAVEDIIATNLLGTIFSTHGALAHMRRQGQGHIVNVASIAGLTGLPWMAAYSASKFGIVGFTESLRRELYGSGITLTAFCPGTVDTAMAAEPLKDPKLRKTINPKSPDEVAEKILNAVRRRSPEVVFGEAPAFVLKVMKFFTRLNDWAMFRIFSKQQPQVRDILSKYPLVFLLSLSLFCSNLQAKETGFNPVDSIFRRLQYPTSAGPLLFIPLMDTNKDFGLRFGTMPIWAIRDKKGDGIAAVMAPSVRYNRFLKTEVSWRTYLFPTDKQLIVMRASYSSAANREIFLRYFNPQYLGTKFRLNAEFHLFRDGKFSFYGFGPDSKEEDKSNYSRDKIGEEFTLAIPLITDWYAEITHSNFHYELGEGPITNLPKLSDRFPGDAILGWKRLVYHRAALLYDSTNHPSLPTKGFFASWAAETSQRSVASDFTFQNYETQFKYYFNMQKGKYVTVANFRFEQQQGEALPFYAQNIVGESAGLRLEGDGRYTDSGRMVLNLEERIRVARSPLLKFFSEIEVSPFLDVATVFSSPGNLRWDSLKPGPGIALRVLLRPQVVITLDTAWLGSRNNLILKVDYPF